MWVFPCLYILKVTFDTYAQKSIIFQGLSEKSGGIKKRKRASYIDNSMAMTRRKEVGKVEEGKGRMNGNGRRFDLGW